MAIGNMGIHMCIVSTRMGGLACALELAKRSFKDIRDCLEPRLRRPDIQLAPNLVGIFDRLRYLADISKEAVELKETSIRLRIGFYFPNEMVKSVLGKIIATLTSLVIDHR